MACAFAAQRRKWPRRCRVGVSGSIWRIPAGVMQPRGRTGVAPEMRLGEAPIASEKGNHMRGIISAIT